MNRVKRIVAFVLCLLYILSVSACSSEAERIQAKSKLVFDQVDALNTTIDSAAIVHYQLKEGCRDRLNMLFLKTKRNQNLTQEKIFASDLYMLDLDTGRWYFEGLFQNAVLNFDTKENALAFFYHEFGRAYGQTTIWENVKVDYLPADEVDRINNAYLEHVASQTTTVCKDEAINLNISSIRKFLIEETVNQPAGIAQNMVVTLAEAIVYLNMRFASLSSGNMDVSCGTNRSLRSAIEIVEDFQLPAMRGDMATCVTYLLCNSIKIDTLVVFVADDSEEGLYPLAVNCIQLGDGYWFFDPSAWMNCCENAAIGGYLPDMKCKSVDAYLENLQQNMTVICAFLVSDGGRMDYQVTDENRIEITADSSCAELIYTQPVA